MKDKGEKAHSLPFECQGMSGNARECQRMAENARECQGMPGNVRMRFFSLGIRPCCSRIFSKSMNEDDIGFEIY
jgi:hypothetical protein